MFGDRPQATVNLPYGEEHEMAGIDHGFAKGFLPSDNSALRARLGEMPVRTTSVEAELWAVMAERREAEATAAPKRRSRRN
jgi:hypothetical protein